MIEPGAGGVYGGGGGRAASNGRKRARADGAAGGGGEFALTPPRKRSRSDVDLDKKREEARRSRSMRCRISASSLALIRNVGQCAEHSGQGRVRIMEADLAPCFIQGGCELVPHHWEPREPDQLNRLRRPRRLDPVCGIVSKGTDASPLGACNNDVADAKGA